MDNQNPGEGGAGGAGEPTEPQAPAAPAPVQEPAKEPKEPSKGDPLDDIQDLEARAEAKAHRAIARRKTGDETPPASAAAPSQPVEHVPPKTVQYLAKQAVSDEVREKWDELMTIPLAGYDATDPESIAKNMTERLAIYKARQPNDNPTRDLTAEPGIRGRSGGIKSPTEKRPIPRPLDADAQAALAYGTKS